MADEIVPSFFELENRLTDEMFNIHALISVVESGLQLRQEMVGGGDYLSEIRVLQIAAKELDLMISKITDVLYRASSLEKEGK